MELVIPPKLWTHEETAAWLRVDALLLTYLIAAGAGPTCYWVGRHRRYAPDEVLAWLTATTTTRKRPGRHASTARTPLARPSGRRSTSPASAA